MILPVNHVAAEVEKLCHAISHAIKEGRATPNFLYNSGTAVLSFVRMHPDLEEEINENLNLISNKTYAYSGPRTVEDIPTFVPMHDWERDFASGVYDRYAEFSSSLQPSHRRINGYHRRN